MSDLRTQDLDAALRFALRAGETTDLDAFRCELLPGLRGLVPCDSLGYNEIDLERGTAIAFSDAPVFDGVERRFLDLAHQHPLVSFQRRGDLHARLISDFLPVSRFHRLELYHDIYRPLGIEDQLAFGLPGECIVAINLGRHKRTFGERDCELLELVRPHLAAAYRRIREQERVRALLGALDQGLAEHGAGVIELDEQGQIEYATEAAQELLEAYIGGYAHERREVPERLRAWLDAHARACNSSSPALSSPGPSSSGGSSLGLVIDGARGRLRVRELRVQARSSRRMLLLTEDRARPPAIEELRSLGLTHRQAQLLRLLACGKSSRQIALELQISTATVSKHLEHIYARLGVSTRAQAIARVLG